MKRRSFKFLNVSLIFKLYHTKQPNMNIDAIQRSYLKEKCIIVNENDEILGSDSKENCHLISNINKGMIHRAFSVFLFNNLNQLLMQERSYDKITFPGYLTNTCCSHPLYNNNEMTEDILTGIKNAAIRKLKHELGVKIGQISVDDLKFMARFHYKALSDNIWGENEIDYVFIVKKDVMLDPNPEEVKRVKYFTQTDLRNIINNEKSIKSPISPWFKLIAKHFLFDWWSNLDELLISDNELNKIHRL
ncbi:isopentenyl-diphosphate Delta-isomerase 1-like isoform X2 [Gordionus sp. m RMFG-2023]|uniref:isopentenyl-diphosphate Delta-isomerase 1-like isoform X2 n=1 Tax=Gordionus sp. m RMFG-2023 TaxID=3053472 RepID=UPI0031FCC6A3